MAEFEAYRACRDPTRRHPHLLPTRPPTPHPADHHRHPGDHHIRTANHTRGIHPTPETARPLLGRRTRRLRLHHRHPPQHHPLTQTFPRERPPGATNKPPAISAGHQAPDSSSALGHRQKRPPTRSRGDVIDPPLGARLNEPRWHRWLSAIYAYAEALAPATRPWPAADAGNADGDTDVVARRRESHPTFVGTNQAMSTPARGADRCCHAARRARRGIRVGSGCLWPFGPTWVRTPPGVRPRIAVPTLGHRHNRPPSDGFQRRLHRLPAGSRPQRRDRRDGTDDGIEQTEGAGGGSGEGDADPAGGPGGREPP